MDDMLEMDLPSFNEPIGLFPLPNVVLLPGGTLPLQIYEARYRAMVRDALRGQEVIGMALLRPGYEAMYYTNRAKVYTIVCVGRIREHARTPDGRYFLILEGVCRARIREEEYDGEYRTAYLDPMIPAEHAIVSDGEYAARDLLRRVIHSRGFDELAIIGNCRDALEGEAPLSEIVDRVAADMLPHDAVDIRQHLLEELDVLRRTATLLNELKVLHQKLDLRRDRLGEIGGPPTSVN